MSPLRSYTSCPGCGRAAPRHEALTFCPLCGARLLGACPGCGQPLRDPLRPDCPHCHAPLLLAVCPTDTPAGAGRDRTARRN
ncbi:hypothetical protein [Deinococcus sedimenti]|uniref:DZANK-type domain-containing protein n=1 Tax=Deinococcus sedimenti TaxID=1867090 RepID=A0ABQ2S3C1_9DEIO|nr:hypothetical protein [Deinococcus sedimenti]GGR90607.1 hypothetical protein GCM10008960_17080 [Deinococcus sedimenti]